MTYDDIVARLTDVGKTEKFLRMRFDHRWCYGYVTAMSEVSIITPDEHGKLCDLIGTWAEKVVI